MLLFLDVLSNERHPCSCNAGWREYYPSKPQLSGFLIQNHVHTRHDSGGAIHFLPVYCHPGGIFVSRFKQQRT